MQVTFVFDGSSGLGATYVSKFLQNKYLVYSLDINKSNVSHENYRYIKTNVLNSEEIKQARNKQNNP